MLWVLVYLHLQRWFFPKSPFSLIFSLAAAGLFKEAIFLELLAFLLPGLPPSLLPLFSKDSQHNLHLLFPKGAQQLLPFFPKDLWQQAVVTTSWGNLSHPIPHRCLALFARVHPSPLLFHLFSLACQSLCHTAFQTLRLLSSLARFLTWFSNWTFLS